jgi:hypothetical protein
MSNVHFTLTLTLTFTFMSMLTLTFTFTFTFTQRRGGRKKTWVWGLRFFPFRAMIGL